MCMKILYLFNFLKVKFVTMNVIISLYYIFMCKLMGKIHAIFKHFLYYILKYFNSTKFNKKCISGHYMLQITRIIISKRTKYYLPSV